MQDSQIFTVTFILYSLTPFFSEPSLAWLYKYSFSKCLTIYFHITYSFSENAQVQILRGNLLYTTFVGRRKGTASTFNPGKYPTVKTKPSFINLVYDSSPKPLKRAPHLTYINHPAFTRVQQISTPKTKQTSKPNLFKLIGYSIPSHNTTRNGNNNRNIGSQRLSNLQHKH